MRFFAYADLVDVSAEELRFEAPDRETAIKEYEQFKARIRATAKYVHGYRLIQLDTDSEWNGGIVVDDMSHFFEESEFL